MVATDIPVPSAHNLDQVLTRLRAHSAAHALDLAALTAPVFPVERYGAVGDGVTDDTTAILAAMAAAKAAGGGTVPLAGRPYRARQRLKFTGTKGITLAGVGPASEIIFDPINPAVDDRCIFIMSFQDDLTTEAQSAYRDLSGAVAQGDLALTAASAGDAADLVTDDWLLITEKDTTWTAAPPLHDILYFDYAQVLSVAGATIYLRHPMRTAFPGTHDTVQFRRVPQQYLSQGHRIRDLSIRSTDPTNALVSVAVGVARDVVIERVTCSPAFGNAFFTHQSKEVTVRDCIATRLTGQSPEFSSTVDLTIDGNTWASHGAPEDGSALVLDFGTAYFQVAHNRLMHGGNIMFQLRGVHDGAIHHNTLSWTRDTGIGAGQGVSAKGCQRVQFDDNILLGGDPGPGGSNTGLAFADDPGATPDLLSEQNHASGNMVRGYAYPYGVDAVVAGSSLEAWNEYLPLTAAAPVTVTATPSVRDGLDGQEVLLLNTGANAITLQDESALAGSNLRLAAASVTLGVRQALRLVFSKAVGDWVQAGPVAGTRTRNCPVALPYKDYATPPVNDGVYGVQVHKLADAATETVWGEIPLPEDHVPGTQVSVRFRWWMQSAASGTVRRRLVAISLRVGTVPSDVGYVDVTADQAVPGTAGHLAETVLTTTTAPTAGDWLRVTLERIGAHANDTASGDLNLLVTAELEYEALQ